MMTEEDRQLVEALHRLYAVNPVGCDGFGMYMKSCATSRQLICRDHECINGAHCKRCPLNCLSNKRHARDT